MRLFELSPTRSVRVTWTLNELGMDCERISAPAPQIFQHPELEKFHPLRKIPALDVDGKGLFESAAICTYLADQAPEKGLISPSGTWERALHDQWVSFLLTELEAWAWSTFLSENIVAEDKRVPEMYEFNREAYRANAIALNDHLAKQDYMVDDKFSVTDIIAGFTCNFGNDQGYHEGFDHIDAYLARLKERPHCTL